MSYQTILQTLAELTLSRRRKSCLNNMLTMAQLLGHPEKKFRSVHVGGTNGKGSVSLKLAKAFEYSNYKCGLFTSPHITDLRERIKIGDQMICETTAETLLSEILEISLKKNISLHYFECCTLLAFQYFAQSQVDIAIIEVGLGGRLDATNIIHPLLSIITSISKDHTEIMGDSELLIAREKAGIIKPFVPIVIGPETPAEIFEEKAAMLQAPLKKVSGSFLHYGLENQAIAKAAIPFLTNHFPLSDQGIEKALSLEPSCRFETIPLSNTTLILDVAHNPAGMARLIERLKLTFPEKNYSFAVGFSATKDIGECARIICTIAKAVYLVEVAHPRLGSNDLLLSHFSNRNVPVFRQSPKEILDQSLSGDGDVLIVCGSFFIMDAFKLCLSQFFPTHQR